jgi:hypothetical protein
MIVELNDANALRDRSNTYKQVESAVDYMVRRNNLDTPWVVHASPISPSDFIDLKAGAMDIISSSQMVIRIGNLKESDESMFSAWTRFSESSHVFTSISALLRTLCRRSQQRKSVREILRICKEYTFYQRRNVNRSAMQRCDVVDTHY